MEKRTKLRTLAAHPTPPNPFCKARVPDRQLVPWLLCSLPDCHLTQHTATHASAHSGVGKQQPQLQGMVHPVHACLRTHELVRTHGLCESVARSMFPLASTHTDTPPAVTSTVTGTLPSFERSTYLVTHKHSQLKNRGWKPQGIAGGSVTTQRFTIPSSTKAEPQDQVSLRFVRATN